MAVNLADVITTTTLEVNTTTLTTMELTTDFSKSPLAVEVFAAVLMSILIMFTFQGNLWIIITVMVTPQLRSCMTNIFVVNLCTVDLLASIVVMPLSVVTFLNGQDALATEVCAMNGFFNTLVMISSMLSLCVISLERYYSISLPMHYAGHATPCMYLIVVTFIWCTSVILSVLPLAGVSSYSYHPAKRTCTYTSQGHPSSGSTFIILLFITSFLVPSLIMITMYVGIFRVARKAAATVGPRPRPVNAIHCGIGIPTERTSTKQPIFTISTHTTPTDILTKTSHSDLQGIASLKDSEYSKKTVPNENSIPLENQSIRPAKVVDSGSLQLLSENKYDSKQEETYKNDGQGKIWLHDHLHRGKVHCKFLCVCCRGHASNPTPSISVGHIQSPDSKLKLHKTEADVQTYPKKNCLEVSNVVGKVKASHTKAVKTLLVIVVTNLLVWGPYFACQVYELAHGLITSQVAQLIIVWLSFTSYTVNPCLYGLMNRTIREELGQLLKIVCHWGCCCEYSQGILTCRRPCHKSPTDNENDEDGCGGEGENFYQFLQRTQASDTTPPANLDTERNR